MILFSPIWLLLLVPLGAGLYAWQLPTRALNIMRGITLGLLVLAMAQPALRLPDRHGYVVVVADRSESMPNNSEDEQLEIIKTLHSEMGSSDRLAVVSFGDRVIHDLSPGVKGMDAFKASGDQQHSRLTDGMEAALSLIPPDDAGRLLILSDGHWTGRDPNTVTAQAAGRGVTIDYRWLSRARAADLAIRDLQVPDSVSPGQAFMLSGWVHSPRAQTIEYELTKHGQAISSGTREMRLGLSRLLFRDRAKISGTAAYQFNIRTPGSMDENGTLAPASGDAFPENNQARALVDVRGTKPILLVSQFGGESGLAKLLVEGGMTLVARKPNQCPWTLDDLSRWSGVVLENVMAGDIGLDGMKTLKAWVEDVGAGLMMTGGEKSFAPGGYYGSPLEEILPVSMERRNEIRKLQTAIVVVLDRSGSMSMSVSGGKTKMDLANLGTAQVLDLLSPTDEFGVIAVDSSPHTILKLASADKQQNAVFRNKILGIQSMGGGIYVYEALEATAKMLQQAKAANKHVILFSDAQDSEQPGNYKQLVATMRKAGITISVIGLGTDKDVDANLLKDIAKRGEGNIYFTDRPTEIPRIFAQDTFAVARNTFIKETTALEITGALNTLGVTSQWKPPTLEGYNLTYKRERASVGMVSRDEYRAPVVAFWQAGNGRVACFTGEADGTYAGAFSQWKEAGDFYATLARWAAGEQSQLPDKMLVTQEVREGVCFVQLHLDPDRAGEKFTQAPQVTVLRNQAGQETRKETLPLKWKTADMMEAALPMEGAETILNTVTIGPNVSQSLPPVCLPYSPEFAPDRADRGRTVLADIGKTTGGRDRLNLAEIWTTLPRQLRFVQLSIWLVIAALILFLLEVLQRRTGFFSFGKRKISTGQEMPGTSTLKRRDPLAQARQSSATEPTDKEKVFRPPKRKRKHRKQQLDDAPPVVAPPMMGDDEGDKPPVIQPFSLDATGNTYDALSMASKRARDRKGKGRE